MSSLDRQRAIRRRSSFQQHHTSLFTLLPLVALLVLHTLPARAVELPFEEETLGSNFEGASMVVLRDIDNDGNLDVFIAGAREVSLLLSLDGVGRFFTFSLPDGVFEFATGAIATADVDGDGDVDLVATRMASDQTSGVWWLENITPHWDGTEEVSVALTFGEQRQVLARSGGVTDVAVGDLNHDGRDDLVLAGVDSDCAFEWLLSVPPGHADEPLAYASHRQPLPAGDALAAARVELADVDGDGFLDVVACSPAGGLYWHRNLAGQSFDTRRWIDTHPLPLRSFVLGDFDGDGDVDVMSAPYIANEEVWFANVDGRGTFELRQRLPPLPTWNSEGARGLAAGDLDGDGDVDIVSTRGGAALVWLKNTDGHGNFSVQTSVASQSDFSAVALGDLDADGDLDAVSSIGVVGSVVFSRNIDPPFAFHTSPASPIALQPTPLAAATPRGVQQLLAADLTGRELLDLVVATPAPSTALLWLEHQAAAPPALVFVPHTIRTWDEDARDLVVRAGDLDNDGRIDLVYSATANRSEALFFSLNRPGPDGLPDFGVAGGTLARAPSLVARELPFTLAHLNDDSYLDILTVSPDRRSALIYLNLGGGGGFESVPLRTSEIGVALASPIAADLDGDGRPEVVFADTSGGAIVWGGLLANGTILDVMRACLAPAPIAVVAADIDGDGDVDLVVLSQRDAAVGWCENLGDREFARRVAFVSLLKEPTDVWVADLDGDTDLDIGVLSRTGEFSWIETLTHAGLSTRARAAVPLTAATPPPSEDAATHRLLIVDLDGDGLPEVLRSSSVDARIDVAFNHFAPPPTRVIVGAAATGANTTDEPSDAACLGNIAKPCQTLEGAMLAARRWRRGAPILQLRGSSTSEETVIQAAREVNLDLLCRTSTQLLVIEVASPPSAPDIGITLFFSFSDGGRFGLTIASALKGGVVHRRQAVIRGGRLTLHLSSVTDSSVTAVVRLAGVTIAMSGERSPGCGAAGFGEWRCVVGGGAVLGTRARHLARSGTVRFLSCGADCPGGALSVDNAILLLSYLDFSNFYSATTLGGTVAAAQLLAPSAFTKVRFANNVGLLGAALQVNQCTLDLRSCSFFNNVGASGGALAITGEGIVTVSGDTVFDSNVATGETTTASGGAIAVDDRRSVVRLQDRVVFTNNSASSSGGALYLGSGTAAVSGDVRFVENRASTTGGAIAVWLGVLSVLSTLVAERNEAKIGGGFASCMGAASAQLGVISTTAGAVVARDNWAGLRGGAVASSQCNLDLTGMRFIGNRVGLMPDVERAPVGGGGLHSDGDSISIAYTEWYNNSALDGANGGAIWYTPPEEASPILSQDGVLEDGNVALEGGGGFFYMFVRPSASVEPPQPLTPGPNTRARYGSHLATQWTQLFLANETVSGVEQTSRVPLRGLLVVELRDYFGQLVTSDTGGAVLGVSTSSPLASVVGNVALSAVHGVVNWTDSQLAVEGVPGTPVMLQIRSLSNDQFSSAIGFSVELRPCRAGERVSADSLTCMPCAAGTFSNTTQAATCFPCPQHTHSAIAGAAECEPCKSREFTEHIGSVECLQCGSFHYARVGTNTTIGCEPCPAHVDCVQYDEVVALTGYWLSKDSRGFVSVVPCGAYRCVGGGRCSAGRAPPEANVLCGSCLEDHVEWSGKCVSCVGSSGARDAALLLTVLVGSLLLVLGFHLLSSQARSSSRVKVFVFFVQAALLVLGSSSFEARTSLSLVSLDPMRALGVSCSLRLSQYARLMFGFSAPALGLGALATLAAMARLIGRPFKAVGASVAAVLVLTFIPTVSTGFEFFQCVDVPVVDALQRVVFAYPEVRCDSLRWRSSSIFVGALLVTWLAVVPVATSVALRKRRRWEATHADAHHHAWSRSLEHEEDRRAMDAAAHAAAFLTGGYRSAAFFYEFVVLARRAALIAINVLLANAANQGLRLLASALLLMACTVLHLVLQPFRRDEENRAESFSLGILCVLPIAMLMADVPLSGSSGVAVVLLLVVLPAAALLAWAVRGFILDRRALAAEARKAEFDRVGLIGVELNESLLGERAASEL